MDFDLKTKRKYIQKIVQTQHAFITQQKIAPDLLLNRYKCGSNKKVGDEIKTKMVGSNDSEKALRKRESKEMKLKRIKQEG